MDRKLGVLLCLAMALGFAGIAEAETKGLTEYVIQPGDTLSQIAEKHGMATVIIQRVNHIKDANMIQEGATLMIPSLDWIAQPFLSSGEKAISGNVQIGPLRKTNLLVGFDVRDTNAADSARFIAVTLSGTNRTLMFDSAKFPDTIAEGGSAEWSFLDLDGDGDSDIIYEYEQGSGVFLTMNAFHFDGENYREHHLAEDISIGFVESRRKKNGFAEIDIYERDTGRLIAVDWEKVRNSPMPEKPVGTGD